MFSFTNNEIIILICITLIFLVIVLKSYKETKKIIEKKRVEFYKRITKSPDSIIVTVDDILSIKNYVKGGNTSPTVVSDLFFPKKLKRYICIPDTLELSKILIHPNVSRDVLRAITISSAMFEIPIPNSLSWIDLRTKFLYELLMDEMKCVYVTIDVEVAEVFTLSMEEKESLYSYVKYVPLIASIFLNISKEKAYPSFEIFAQTCRSKIKHSGTHYVLSDYDISTMLTAFSEHANIAIPVSYTADDVRVAASLIKLLKTKEKNSLKPLKFKIIK
jgi:hypothetical protein